MKSKIYQGQLDSDAHARLNHQRRCCCGLTSACTPLLPASTSRFLSLPISLSFSLFNSEAAMTGDKLAVSPRTSHQGQQKINCLQSIPQYSLSLSFSIALSLPLSVTFCSSHQTHRKCSPLERTQYKTLSTLR